ncbi:Peptidoglycan/LPS O-acetylase OafA/YrhL, contains acyltransferase and SGNH-hydrolase domains [Burkholderia sp. YR290]|nr:Peptidoglycan/LPS O-acetylase OafA/YrhL, contains acyltransferase and SGNH-hydrolase domains [Burkholderia sp. YR290]
MKYRADIDGLRAIAVLSIVIYHLGWSIVPGGFVGVDIFFVISGYLISKAIFSDVNAFSISDFYLRRIRRIIPALVVVLIACTIIAIKLLYPPELVDYAKSAIAASLFSANIYFYSVLNYFSPSADGIPLLHLWSLGVEEQFYIFFPLVAVAIARRLKRATSWALIIGALASLGASQWMLSVNPSASFYLIPFRAFELLTGCIIALPRIRTVSNPAASVAIFSIGMAALAWSIFGYNTFTAFPGISAALPCLGAAAIILASEVHQGVLVKLLGARPFVYIGKISYSLYLVHWPIIVFGKRIFPDASPYYFGLCALALSILLSSVIYSYVEQPFRRSRRFASRTVFSTTAVAICSMVALGAFVVKAQGFPGGVDSRIAHIVAYGHYDMASQFRERVCFLDPEQDPIGIDFAACVPHGKGPKLILWGDSFAAMLGAGLEETLHAKGYAFGFLSSSGCAPAINYEAANRPNCKKFNDVAFPIISRVHPDAVVMAAQYGITVGSQMDQLDKTIKLLSSQGIKVILLGIPPYYKRAVPQLVLERIQSGRSLGPAPEELKRDYLDPTEDYMEKRFSNRTDVKYISVLSVMCPQYKCPLVTGDEVPVHFDQAHLTLAGSRLFAKNLTPLILNDAFPMGDRSSAFRQDDPLIAKEKHSG